MGGNPRAEESTVKASPILPERLGENMLQDHFIRQDSPDSVGKLVKNTNSVSPLQKQKASDTKVQG